MLARVNELVKAEFRESKEHLGAANTSGIYTPGQALSMDLTENTGKS